MIENFNVSSPHKYDEIDLLKSRILALENRQKILVPPNSTFDRNTENHIVLSQMPFYVTIKSHYTFPSPFGNKICDSKILLKLDNVWTFVETIYEGQTYGIITSVPGDGYVYASTGGLLNASNSGGDAATCVVPYVKTSRNFTSAEWVIIVTAP